MYFAMSPSDFNKSSPGRVVKTLSGDFAYEPGALPGHFAWSNALVSAVNAASTALAHLQGLGSKLANPQRLVRMFLRREAEASSRIEQTFARVRTMLLFEHLPEVEQSAPSVHEVDNNFRVLEESFRIVRKRRLTLMDMRGLHAMLFDGVEQSPRNVGQFRQIQNWIGNSRKIEEARYVPPPPASVPHLMQQLVDFMAEQDDLPTVVRAAMIHYQFEAIHPFEDGNGRIGRALVLAQFHREGALTEPLLNPSAGLERNRRAYYDALLEVSTRGNWENWIVLFSRTIRDEAGESVKKLHRLEALREKYATKVRGAGSGARLVALVDHLMGEPAMSAKQAAKLFNVTPAAGQHMLEKLERLNIVREMTGKQRNRVWLAHGYVDVFSSERE
jgi:Fic family protein